MSAFDTISGLALDFTARDKAEAAKIRAANNIRFESDPIAWSARRALDQAESFAPATTATSSSSTSFSYGGSPSSGRVNVQQAGREAMSQLKNVLQSIRSKQHSQFNESVPPSSTETRIRGTIGIDQVNSNVPTNGPAKTAVTANIRPLNKQSFELARAHYCEAHGIPIKTEGGEAEAVISVKLRLKPGTSQQDQKDLLEVLSVHLPKIESEEDTGVACKIENISGCPHLVLSYVHKEAEKDPLEKAVSNFVRNMLDLYRGDAAVEEAANQAPGLFRLATIRAELPHSLGDFVNAAEPQSYFKLLEAGRVAFEAILRHDAHKILHEHLASQLVKSFDKDDLMSTAMLPSLYTLSRDSSIDIKAAPFELLYAMLVKEASFYNRRMKEVDGISNAIKKKESAASTYAEYFDSDAPECLTAMLASDALFTGLGNHYFKQGILSTLGRNIVAAQEDDDAEDARTGHIVCLLSKCVAEVVSCEIIAHSFHLTCEFQGIDDQIWRFFPTSPQAVVDLCRPLALASKSEFDPAAPDAELDASESKLTDSDLRHRRFWPQGVYEDRADAIGEIVGPGLYLDTDGAHQVINAPKKRNAAFRVCVVVNSADKEKSWARLLKAFGTELFDPKADKQGGKREQGGGADGGAEEKADSDADSSDADGEDDDEGTVELPDPTEGYMRVAYQRRSDGRYVEYIRPNSEEEFSIGLLARCDAIVIVDSVDDIELLKSVFAESEAEDETFAGVTAPVLFVSTKSDVANAENNGSVPKTLFTPKAVDYRVLATSSAAAESSAADAMLNWLISNSENPSRGTSAAEPASAWDFGYEMNIAIP